jgi:seryl-tRNA synthetase
MKQRKKETQKTRKEKKRKAKQRKETKRKSLKRKRVALPTINARIEPIPAPDVPNYAC